MSGADDLPILPQHEALLATHTDADPGDRQTVREALLLMLQEDRKLAYQTKQPAVAVSASVSIAKLLGLFHDTSPVVPVRIVFNPDDMVVC